MGRKYTPHYPGNKGVLIEPPVEGIQLARGTTIPTDGTAGYCPGCLFIHTDGSGAADLTYRNDGTLASCDFNALTGTDLSALAATAAEINRVADVSARVVNATADLTVVEATHEGKVVTLNKADGLTVTLPAATGGGARYTFIVGTTITSNQYRWSVTGNDTLFGSALFDDGDGEPANGWTAGGGNNQINLGGTSNATGGVKGDVVELIDIAADTWFVQIRGTQGGTEATPFATV